MNVLFVHQNFPGQYRHVAAALADDPANVVLAIGEAGNLGRLPHPRVREIGYPAPEPAGPHTHHCAVVASATPPVQEVIRDGENGLLFDFFDGDALVDRVCAVLDDPHHLAAMRAAARRTVIDTYDLSTVCLPRQLELIRTLASGHRPAHGPTAPLPAPTSA